MHSVNSFWNILELKNLLVIILISCYCFVMHSHAQSLKNFVLVVVLFSVIFLLPINIQKLSEASWWHGEAVSSTSLLHRHH